MNKVTAIIGYSIAAIGVTTRDAGAAPSGLRVNMIIPWWFKSVWTVFAAWVGDICLILCCYILGIQWSEPITNDEVLEPKHLLKSQLQIKRSRLCLLGPVVHLDNSVWAKQVLLAACCSPPQSQSHPLLSWVSQVVETLEEVVTTASNCHIFSSLVSKVTWCGHGCSMSISASM